MIERKLTYYPQHDIPSNPDIVDNLRSLLGERFNVLENTVSYAAIGGKLYKFGSSEPFIDVIKRGRDFMRAYPDPIDYKREDAEVIGFQKIQDTLTDPSTPIGTMIVSISPSGPEGSAYKKNFYDIFTKQEHSVEAKRYSSDLTLAEYAKFMLDMGYKWEGEEADDAFFLSNPFSIPQGKFKNVQDLHNYLFREHEYITVAEFEEIWKDSEAAAASYLKAVAEGDIELKNRSMNVLLNSADMSHFGMKDEVFRASDSKERFFVLATRPVRVVNTGCGASCGISLGESPLSVSEFGKARNYKFDKKGSCRVCGTEAFCGPVGICEKCNDNIDMKEALARKFVL
jgi:hypothetical protein